MPRRRLIPFVVVIAGAGAIAVPAAFLATVARETTLEFRIRDRVSGGAVWNATVTLQDRFLRTYYAGGEDPLVFTRLAPGPAMLEVSAPDYQSVSRPVTLRRGRNRLDEPIDMIGLRIPDLSHFIVSEDFSGSNLQAAIWPISTQGPAVVNHPALDLWVGARVSIQQSGGRTAARGDTLFAGEIEWTWDHSPGALSRYRARIPLDGIERSGGGPFVIDYLLIVPDPLAIERDEVAAIVKAAWIDGGGPATLEPYLTQYGDRFDFYVHSSWNLSRR